MITINRKLSWLGYSTALLLTIATSPLYEYFGTTAFTQQTIELTPDNPQIPFWASVSVDATQAEPFNTCAWDMVFELDQPLTLDTELILWGLNAPWDQETFDAAYAVALEQVGETEDTGGQDTGGQDTSTEPLDTGLSGDTAQDTGGVSVEPYAQLNPEFAVFYQTMQTFSEYKYAYRIVDDGEIKGPLFEDYASIVVQDGRRFLYYSACGAITDHFVLTLNGTPVSTSLNMTVISHQTEGVAQPIGCNSDKNNPDYSGVVMEVTVVSE